jgi:di/tricarboxylate transporter
MPFSGTRSSITTAWVIVLAAALWFASSLVSTAALIGLAAIGLAPLAVMFFLARRPELTTAEQIRQVQTGPRP